MALKSMRYDHPAYLVRQLVVLGATAATNGATNAQFTSPIAFRIRNVSGVVRTAGTTSTNTLTLRNGTTSLGLLTLADSAAGFVATTGDLNVAVAAGDVVNLLKGTDATGIAGVTMEIDYPAGTSFNV